LTETVKLLFWWLHRVSVVRTSLFAQCSQTITLQTFYVIMKSLKGSYNAIIQVNMIL